MIYSKNKFRFLTNCQNIICSILSQHGITSKHAYFLKSLKSWAVIKVKRKKLTEDNNRLSSILRTSVIILYF